MWLGMSRQGRLAPPLQLPTAQAVIAHSASADSGSDTPRRLSASPDGRLAAPAREASLPVTNPLTIYSILPRCFRLAEGVRSVPLPGADSPCCDCVDDTAKGPVYRRVFRRMFLSSDSGTFRPNRAAFAPAQTPVALFLPTTRQSGPQALPSVKTRLAGQDVLLSGRGRVVKTRAPSTPIYGCLPVKRWNASMNPQPLANRKNQTDV